MTSLRAVELIGADGTRHDVLCGNLGDYQVGTFPGLHGLTGHSFQSRRVANISGERLTGHHTEPKVFPLPITIIGTESEHDTKLGALGRILSPDLDVRIVYTRPDGTSREITARCLNADAVDIEHAESRSARIPLVFKAFDPYWRSVDEDEAIYTSTFADYRVGQNSLAVELTNNGDVDTWPEVTITGYSENVEATNLETGQVWRVRRIIDLNEVVRIESDPARAHSVWLDDVLDYRTVMSETTAEFWPLVPGLNRIVIRAWSNPVGNQIGDITLRWVERFATC